MEKIDDKDTIDSKYIIIDKKGHGASSSVYLVREIKTQKVYAAKVLKKEQDLFQNEINILNILKPYKNPNITNLVSSGKGLIFREKSPQKSTPYLVLEYASKGEFFNYIYYAHSGFNELHSKYIFSKILNGIEACHNAGICHRDLKMQNILVDENFNPRLCDFGFATKNNDHLTDYLGTLQYAAPEILINQPYDGFKADIFSLGVILLILNTCKFGFLNASKLDPYYKLIIDKRINKYWNSVSNQITNISKELKDLFIQMVSYLPQERPSIKDIFNSNWMKEIKDMNDEQLEQLENEIREEFLRREKLVNEGLKKEMELKQKSNESSGNRGIEDDIEEFFDLSLKPKYAQTGINMNNYIKLRGDLNPNNFMNTLANKIIKEYKNGCEIEPIPDKFKFNIIFEYKKIDNYTSDNDFEQLGIEDIEQIYIGKNEKIKGQKTVIQIKLFESYNGGYLLRFVKKDGDLNNYLNYIEKISSFLKQN